MDEYASVFTSNVLYCADYAVNIYTGCKILVFGILGLRHTWVENGLADKGEC
jgi:hypothetical protein